MQQIITFFSETCRLLSYPFDLWAFPNYTCKNVYYFIWIYDKGFILIHALRVFVLWEINFRRAILKVEILFFFFFFTFGKVEKSDDFMRYSTLILVCLSLVYCVTWPIIGFFFDDNAQIWNSSWRQYYRISLLNEIP